MTQIRLQNLSKRFGQTVALHDIDFQIAAGELFFLLGPSGCGKSTLLRLIAGLIEPTGGRIFFNERDVTNLPTQQRNAVMCFQSYALWPHMTVEQNVRFGLDVRKISPEKQKQRIDEVLRLVQLNTMSGRKPGTLSGGQQQRAALARALVVQPDCLLLDEPLSNLDARLRLEMRGEIRRICKSTGFTTIYVTHDQKEALSVADRIALMKDGKIEQIGTPVELYRKPRTSFVADFIGQANLIPGNVIGREEGIVIVQTPLGTFRVAGASAKEKVILSIRPEQLRIAGNSSAGANRICGKVAQTTFLGEATEVLLSVNDRKIKINAAPPLPDVPAELCVEFDPADASLLSE